MTRRKTVRLLLAVLAASGGACRRSVRTYAANGLVVAVAEDRLSVVIRHDEIENFMPAMTMKMAVKNPRLLDGIAANDTVRFRLAVGADESWISAIERTGRSNAAPGETADRKIAGFSLRDQDGRNVGLPDLAGKAVAITFIYTRCPLPDYCPRFTANFADIQRRLAPRFTGRFRLLSVTLDPAHDTPALLKRYGQKHGSDFRVWTYLTGSEVEIRALARTYGVEFQNQQGLIEHTAACVVIAPSGKLHKLYRGNTWTPGEVAEDIERLLGEGISE